MSLTKANQLQEQAKDLLNRVEVLADSGNRQAENMLMDIWHRYQRRAKTTNELYFQRWGSL